ncbi:MAG: 50S ribosomal protein L24 [Candidatus Hadarchaeia archaeon]
MSDTKNEPLHKKIKSISATLSSDLREEYGFRTLSLREGDEVRVLRGDFKGMEGEITEVDTDKRRVVVEGVETATADETEVPRPVHASNLELTDLVSDEMRDKIIKRRSESGEKRSEETSEASQRAED